MEIINAGTAVGSVLPPPLIGIILLTAGWRFTYLYFKGVPLYAFCHSLSYTQFKYSNLKLSQARTNASGEVNVSFDLQNAGATAGSRWPRCTSIRKSRT
jgi:hypothetical protein